MLISTANFNYASAAILKNIFCGFFVGGLGDGYRL
jgi:hypothetical protein